MTFAFKQTSADFRVSEELPFALAGKGEALYVYIEKRNVTTQEVILHLRKKLKLSRLSLGIAGLKDKKAIAKQWISIYDRALKKAGGERLFVDTLAEIVKIIEVSRHSFPLNLSTPISNRFSLHFKAQKHLGQQERKEAQEIVQELLSKGYPNWYGEQRFGIGGRNTTQGWELLHGTSKEKKEMTKADIVFKIQAFASHVFNEFVERVDPAVVDGTILTRTAQGKVQWGVYEEATKSVVLTEIKGADSAATFAVKKSGKTVPYAPASMVAT
jgi:tRNA pseudouridine13 synthase